MDHPDAGNRFDSPTGDFSVCYFATTLEGCFGETLARFRPDPGLIAAAAEEGFMPAGEVPQDWRTRRVAVNARFVLAPPLAGEIRFLDVEPLATRRVLRDELAELMAYYGISDMDVATVRGGDRRITRWIAKWAFDQRDDEGRPVFAGVRYLSRLSSEWECWAVFHDVSIDEVSRQTIRQTDPDLQRVARLHGLHVF